MGNPAFEHTWGECEIDGKNLLVMKSDERSKAWLFLSFQNVPEIEGINLRDYLRTIYNAMLKSHFPQTPVLTPFVFKRFIVPSSIHIQHYYVRRWHRQLLCMCSTRLIVRAITITHINYIVQH
jgi:Fe-S cluster assembly ATPase SufC